MQQSKEFLENTGILENMPLSYQLTLKERALSATAEGISISDNLQPDNPIIYANHGFEKLTGYKISDVLGRNCRFLQGPKTSQQTLDKLRQAMHKGHECTVELLNYHKNGSTFWNRLSLTPLKDTTGRVTHFIGVQSDITIRKNAEEALLKTQKELETANQRMRQDLEEARQLQLAMLPDKLPELPQLEMAVYMKTATEVGGDYYDFHRDDDELTIAFGDATGHGLKAGTIVTATKSLFNSLAAHPDPIYILNKISLALKEMGFRNMFMAMMIAKIKARTLQLSSAGMPFALLYRAQQQTVTPIELKGLPLGFIADIPYELREITLSKGDTILLMSDGLPEMFNPQKELFGEEQVVTTFKQLAEKPAQSIIDGLIQKAADWGDMDNLRDDITLLVIKIR